MSTNEHETEAPRVQIVPMSAQLSPEQRERVEALHAARKVVGPSHHATSGELHPGWAWQVVELADYIVTGSLDHGLDDEADRDQTPASGVVVDLNGQLPDNLPPQVAAVLKKLQGEFRPGGVLPSGEDRVKRTRDYVDRYRNKPDGMKELNSQGYFPVDGSEPPRSEPLHDVHCHRWTFNTTTSRWEREKPAGPADVHAGLAGSLVGTWGSALAAHGPFHVCI